MDYSDTILFEEYFHMNNHNKNYNKKYFDLFINIILNSKEFLDSGVKLSNNEQETTLLSLSINQKGGSDSAFSFYATYSVKDGEFVENRDIIGSILIKRGKIYLVSNIHRYCDHGLIDFELGEIFTINKDSFSRISSYNVSSSIESVSFSEKEFEKANEFKENALKRIRK